MNAISLTDAFQQCFTLGQDTGDPVIFRAPGRVNIIGEHTDYNQGFVLPAAADLYCWAAISRRTNENNAPKLIIYSENFDAVSETTLEDLQPAQKWSDYPVGVASQLKKLGIRLEGANLYLRGDIPLGGGLSSSAAVEVATCCALLHAAGKTLDREEMALLCQRAENEFVGTKCGVMDQFTSCFGRAGHALLLDCRSLEFEAVPVPSQIRLVVCDSMVKHELSGGEYNRRRLECEEAVEKLFAVLPGIRALRDVTLLDLEKHRDRLSPIIYRRCRHVVTENARVQLMARALRDTDTSAMTALMAASHASLRDDFEVSIEELNLLVELAGRQKGVFGARMMGGGFGGCTINLVGEEHVSNFRTAISDQYAAATGRKPDMYTCIPADGAGRIP